MPLIKYPKTRQWCFFLTNFLGWQHPALKYLSRSSCIGTDIGFSMVVLNLSFVDLLLHGLSTISSTTKVAFIIGSRGLSISSLSPYTKQKAISKNTRLSSIADKFWIFIPFSVEFLFIGLSLEKDFQPINALTNFVSSKMDL